MLLLLLPVEDPNPTRFCLYLGPSVPLHLSATGNLLSQVPFLLPKTVWGFWKCVSLFFCCKQHYSTDQVSFQEERLILAHHSRGLRLVQNTGWKKAFDALPQWSYGILNSIPIRCQRPGHYTLKLDQVSTLLVSHSGGYPSTWASQRVEYSQTRVGSLPYSPQMPPLGTPFSCTSSVYKCIAQSSWKWE